MRDEADLLEAWQRGNAAAGEQLVSRYRDKLFRFFDLRVSLDAEDLTQRTLLACVESRDDIRSRASFRSFVFGTARNILLQHIRDRTRDARVDDFSDVSGVDPGPSPSRVVAAHEEQRILLLALQRLPLDTQLVLGDAIGMPRSTVTTRLHRARAALREEIASMPVGERARASLIDDLERWASSLRNLEAHLPTAKSP
jgi:RNA polymerase sigma factor (sigma-70 family)